MEGIWHVLITRQSHISLQGIVYGLHLERHPFPHYPGNISGGLSDSHEKLRLVVKGGQTVRFRKIHAGRIIGRTDIVCRFTLTEIYLDGRKYPFYGFPESGLLVPCRIMVDREHVVVQPVTGYLPMAVERRPVPAKPVNQIPQPPFAKIVLYFMIEVLHLSIYSNTPCSDLTSFGSPTHLYSTSHQFGMAYLLSLLTI